MINKKSFRNIIIQAILIMDNVSNWVIHIYIFANPTLITHSRPFQVLIPKFHCFSLSGPSSPASLFILAKSA